jgi:hypothetical protein
MYVLFSWFSFAGLGTGSFSRKNKGAESNSTPLRGFPVAKTFHESEGLPRIEIDFRPSETGAGSSFSGVWKPHFEGSSRMPQR